MINHLWQSTLFAGLAALLTLALRGNAARTRYWVWFAASAKFLIPFSLLVVLGQQVHLPVIAVQVAKIPVLLEQIAQPIPSTPPSAATSATAQQSISLQTSSPQLSVPLSEPAARPTNWRSILLTLWACGSLFVTLRWAREWLRLRAVLRSGHPVELGVPLRAILSPTLREPGVFGVFRPILLLPQGILETLAPEELRAVLIHELTHVRRRDNLFAGIHMATEAIFWFHPLVWWIGRRMIEERERACDEAVLQAGNAPSAYAEGILKVCEHYLESPLACASGVTGADLKQRIREIMQHRMVRNLNLGKKALLCAAGALAFALPIALGTAVNLMHPPAAKAQSIPPPVAVYKRAMPEPVVPPSAAPSEPRESPAETLRRAFTKSFDDAITAVTQAPVLLAQASPPAAPDAATAVATPVPQLRGQRLLTGTVPGTPVSCAELTIRLIVDEEGHPKSLERLPPAPFEVLSIRPHVNSSRPAVITAGNVPGGFMKITLDSPRAISGNQVTLQIVTLGDLIASAYCVGPDQIAFGSAGPTWRDQTYDVMAKLPEGMPASLNPIRMVRGMLQAALADRFQLKLHNAIAERPVYNLVVAKSGLKMRSIATGDSGAPEKNNRRQTLGELLRVIGARVDRPVIDETGLFGTFEYSLDFMREIAYASDTTAIFTAVQDHLGLRLEAAKPLVPTLIIDSVEKPTEN